MSCDHFVRRYSLYKFYTTTHTISEIITDKRAFLDISLNRVYTCLPTI